MTCSKFIPVLIATAACVSLPNIASAQRHAGGARGGAVVHGGAVVRGGGGHVVTGGHAVARPYGPYGGRGYGGRGYYYPARVVYPHVVGVVPYRPYYYGYRPGLTIGFLAGFGYGYRYPYYPYYGYPYPYSYPYYYGSAYPAYSGYAYPPAQYVSAQPGYTYGGVHIEGAPGNAQVFADGYYVGIVDDFNGAGQHLNLTSGPHRIEIRMPDDPQPVAFDVNVPPGQTITVRVQ
jgi:hypothetical protein